MTWNDREVIVFRLNETLTDLEIMYHNKDLKKISSAVFMGEGVLCLLKNINCLKFVKYEEEDKPCYSYYPEEEGRIFYLAPTIQSDRSIEP